MIITYQDQEVQTFHPICEESLRQALVLLGIANQYEVKHHEYIGTLEMDFVILNKSTGRVLCVIEVKRTPSAVKSSRYQYQAMSYIQQTPPSRLEKPYYILTNLECSTLFKFSEKLRNVHQQIVEPGFTHNISFSQISSREELIEKSSRHYASLLKTVIDDSGVYVKGYKSVVDAIVEYKEDTGKWNSQFAKLAYEYIRGAYDALKINVPINDIREYAQRLTSLSSVFSKIDFKGIFGLEADAYSDLPNISNDLLSASYKLGQSNVDADEIVSVLHYLVSKDFEIEGEVPTDIELARVLGLFAAHYQPTVNGAFCDPAAGSGNLISCVNEFYPSIAPHQIKANDKNPLLLQLLSLRLGLKYAGALNPANAPEVTNSNVSDLPASYFDDVEVILLNPPMVSGITAQSRNAELYSALKEAGHAPKTNVSLPPLEMAFVEYVCAKAHKGALILCLIPKTHLTALGLAAQAFRKFLLTDFGLQSVFTYPGTGLFSNVSRDTLLIVGRIGKPSAHIRAMSTLLPIKDIEFSTLKAALNTPESSNLEGVKTVFVETKVLEEHIEDGWFVLDDFNDEIDRFLLEYFGNQELFTSVQDSPYNSYRGKVGNLGGTDFLYTTRKPEILACLTDSDKALLKPGLVNAKFPSLEIGQGDHQFFNFAAVSEARGKAILEKMLPLATAKGKQPKKVKTIQEWLDILRKEGRNIVPAHSILIPRNLRVTGKAYRAPFATYVSTNFIVVEQPDSRTSTVVASWMNTIFYQLMCERYCKNHEGTRKMEEEQINQTLIPNVDYLSSEDISEILTAYQSIDSGLNVTNIIPRPVDKIWSKVLFGDNSEAVLDNAVDLLTRAIVKRNP